MWPNDHEKETCIECRQIKEDTTKDFVFVIRILNEFAITIYGVQKNKIEWNNAH